MLPGDLQPIPTQPWDERPEDLPLQEEEVRTALWLDRGNISLAAERLKIRTARLRNYVNNKPRLLAEQREAREQLVDRAEEVVAEALNDNTDAGRRDGMAKFVMNSEVARNRGLSARPAPALSIKNSGNLVIGWLGTGELPPGATGTIIEGEVVNDG